MIEKIYSTKKYLMYAMCFQAILMMISFGSLPFILFSAWMMVVLLCDAKNMIKEYFPEHIMFSIYVVALLISCVLNRPVTVNNSYLLTFQAFMIYYVLFVGNRNKAQNQKTVLIIIKFAAVVFCICSIINAINFSLHLNLFPHDLEYSRLSGIYGNPNTMGICAAFGLFGGFLFENKPFKYLNAVLQLVMIVISDCRSMLLGLMVIAGFLFLRWFHGKVSKKSFYVATGVFICMSGCFGLYILVKRFIGTSELSGSINNLLRVLTSGRYHIWTQSIYMWKQKPLFGIGPYNRLAYMESMLPRELLDLCRQYNYDHNMFVGVLLSSGIVGFTGFTGWLIQQARRIGKHLEIFKNNVNLIILALVFLSFVNGLLDVAIVFDIRIVTYIFWLGLGYLIKECTSEEEKN